MWCAVLKHWHPMVGFDYHTPFPYITFQLMGGFKTLCYYSPNFFTHGKGYTMLRGTDIGFGIVHFPLPPFIPFNIVTAVISTILSGSKSHFGASKFQYPDQGGVKRPAAVALLGNRGINLNCGCVWPLPSAVFAITTHYVGISLGDLLYGIFMMALDALVLAALNKLGSKVGDKLKNGFTKIYQKLGSAILVKLNFTSVSKVTMTEITQISSRYFTLTSIRQVTIIRALSLQVSFLIKNPAGAIVRNWDTRIWGAALSPLWSFIAGSPMGISLSNVKEGSALWDKTGKPLYDGTEGGADTFQNYLDDTDFVEPFNRYLNDGEQMELIEASQEKAAEIAKTVGKKSAEIVESVEDKSAEIVESIEDKAKEINDSIEEEVNKINDSIENEVNEAKDTIENNLEEIEDELENKAKKEIRKGLEAIKRKIIPPPPQPPLY